MINIKKWNYVIGFILLAMIVIGSGLLIWNIMSNNNKQQDKVYSGAKLVYFTPEYQVAKGDANG
ncbi:MAG: hypothetical protein WBI88_04185 [Caldicoprobacterales bacterium]